MVEKRKKKTKSLLRERPPLGFISSPGKSFSPRKIARERILGGTGGRDSLIWSHVTTQTDSIARRIAACLLFHRVRGMWESPTENFKFDYARCCATRNFCVSYLFFSLTFVLSLLFLFYPGAGPYAISLHREQGQFVGGSLLWLRLTSKHAD